MSIKEIEKALRLYRMVGSATAEARAMLKEKPPDGSDEWTHRMAAYGALGKMLVECDWFKEFEAERNGQSHADG